MPARLGRKRKDGEREPNGRLSRAGRLAAGKPFLAAEAVRLREAALKGMRDETWAWQIGQLFVHEKIKAHEYDAGKRFARLTVASLEARGMPSPHPRGLNLGGSGKSYDADPDSERGIAEAERAIQLAADLKRAKDSVRPWLLPVIEHVCEKDLTPVGVYPIQWVQDGLSDLAAHWGMSTGK